MADGSYSFAGVSVGGTYVVTPSLSGYAFTPLSKSTGTIAGDVSNFNFTYGKQWSGAGLDALASNPSNWTAGIAPITNDLVRFDGTNSSKGCVWDLNTFMERIELKVGYSSSVVVVTDMFLGHVTIEAGEFLMGAYEITIGKNFSHTGGRFRSSTGGTIFWTGTSLQTVAMTPTSLGSGLFDSYFHNFRVQSSSTVRATADLIVDGTFNISSGRFESMGGTHTFTGGTQSGVGGTFNWDISAGDFAPSLGQILFDSRANGTYQVRSGSANAILNLSGAGNVALVFLSSITVNGNLSLGGSGSALTSDWGSGFTHNVVGSALIGPASNSGSPTITLGASTINFFNGVVIGTATMSVQSGLINVRSSTLNVTGQGNLIVPTGQTGTFVFWNNTHLQLSGGTLLVQGPSIFTSSASGVTRFSTDMSGTVNIQTTTVLGSMNAHGFRLGVGAVPVNLKGLDFVSGPTGGAAINFDPVTQSNVTLDSPRFDVSFSTNVRAIINPSVLAAADIDVIDSTGSKTGPSYEYDPDGIVNWGTLGVPTNFSGTTLGVSSITWSWSKVNHPLGFVVKSSTGGALSPSLTLNTTYWTEIGLSTNTAYTRYVEAFTDVSQAASSQVTRYTEALPASTVSFPSVFISSLTLTWDLNGNPSGTHFIIERSTNDVSYTQLASGTVASLAPYLDTGLTAEKLYYYRVKTQNGNGDIVPASVKASTTTAAVPAAYIFMISPSTVSNLGQKTFTVTGAFIQMGAVIRFKRSGSPRVFPESFEVVEPSTITAIMKMSGVTAGMWDVEIENPDGKISAASGAGILTVTNAVSATPVTIQTLTSASGISFTTTGGESTLTVASAALPDSRLYISADPENTPLEIDSGVISEANASLRGLTLIPSSVREVMAYTSQGAYTSGFTGPVSLGIRYPDLNSDGIIDSILLRVSGIRLLNLNEDTHRWEAVSGVVIDPSTKFVSASLSHFSVYALAASPTSATLAEAKVYPSPWKKGSAGRFDASSLSITNLTESGTVRIYSLSAELIKKITYDLVDVGVVSWNGTNEDGEPVKSGVYLINIESSAGENKTLKVGIER
ncbi:MAG: hypothetical protein KCHDKBKB_01463 [Elusimicrobia bacterium]|nr:hypothetical protein [Elusimicrobiota bacterium]